MKFGSFIIYTLVFCAAWLGLAAWGWVPAQALSQALVMPWVLPMLWHPVVAFAIGGAIAILGSFLAAMVLLVVLFVLEAIRHFLQSSSAKIPS